MKIHFNNKRTNMYKSLPFLALLYMLFSSCEDIIKVSVPSTAPVLAIDAWITDRSGGDTISLYTTQNYFINKPNVLVTGATLSINSSTEHEDLKEILPGKYLVNTIRAKVGATYTLNINVLGELYQASTTIIRTSPIIDSIRYQYKSKSPLFDTAGYYGYLFGQELPGKGDYVRIRFYVNGVFQNTKNTLSIFNDEFTDGKYLRGLRLSQRSPFKKGDHIAVETWSLSKDSYDFFSDLRTQINNQGIFTKTPVNVRTNIFSKRSGSKPVTGFFGGSLVQRYESTIY